MTATTTKNIPGVRERLEDLLKAQRSRLAAMKDHHVDRAGMSDDEIARLDAQQAQDKATMREIENHITNLMYLLESPEFTREGLSSVQEIAEEMAQAFLAGDKLSAIEGLLRRPPFEVAALTAHVYAKLSRKDERKADQYRRMLWQLA